MSCSMPIAQPILRAHCKTESANYEGNRLKSGQIDIPLMFFWEKKSCIFEMEILRD